MAFDLKLRNGEREDISDYERIRLFNITERKSKYVELNLDQLKSDLKRKQKQSSKGPKKVYTPRKSLRLQMKPQKQYAEKKKPRDTSRAMSDDSESESDSDQSYPTWELDKYISTADNMERLPMAHLDLQYISEDYESLGKLFETAGSYISNMELPQKRQLRDGVSIGKSLEALKRDDDYATKIMFDIMTSMAIHPTEDELLVAAGNRCGSIGIRAINAETALHRVETFEHHTKKVSHLSFDEYDAARLLSVSHDGTIRVFDINAQKSLDLFAFHEDDASAYANDIGQIDRHCFLMTMGKSGKIGLVDARKSNVQAVAIFNLFTNGPPRTVHVHPVKKYRFVAPDQKGSCGIFDLRSLSKKPTLWLRGNSRAVRSASFSPGNGSKVLAQSNDIIAVFNLKEESNGIDKQPNCTIESGGSNVFRAEWYPRNDDLFLASLVGNPRQIELINTINLGRHTLDDSTTSICSFMKCHPTLDVVVLGTGSGYLNVFK